MKRTMMKRISGALLAGCVTLGLATPAFAAENANTRLAQENVASTEEASANVNDTEITGTTNGIDGLREISIKDIENLEIGQYENAEAGTGCTVLICRDGMPAGLDVRGGGPASRESELLKPVATADRIHAVVLGGGSAYGLGAADGVMKCLEENDIGYDVGVCKVPLVCQSDIFDLTVGSFDVRPDSSYGYQAALAALNGGNYQDGNYGAGCGASVGKWQGMDYCMKSGIGSYAVQIGDLKLGAIVCVNALGDVYDWKTGQEVAGMMNSAKNGFQDTLQMMLQKTEVIENKFTGNTTIGVIVTNAAFNKTQLCKIASMTHNGYARSIRPVHTSADGDSIYAVSVGDLAADQDLIGTLAADVMSEAILRAVQNCDSAYGYTAAKDLPANFGVN